MLRMHYSIILQPLSPSPSCCFASNPPQVGVLSPISLHMPSKHKDVQCLLDNVFLHGFTDAVIYRFVL